MLCALGLNPELRASIASGSICVQNTVAPTERQRGWRIGPSSTWPQRQMQLATQQYTGGSPGISRTCERKPEQQHERHQRAHPRFPRI